MYADFTLPYFHAINMALNIFFFFFFPLTKAFANNCGNLCLVRVGRKSHIHPSVMKFTLDSMTKHILEKASTSTTEDNLNVLKEKLQSTAANEKKLQREIWMLQTSPQPNDFEVFVLLSCYFVIKYLLYKLGLPHVKKWSKK